MGVLILIIIAVFALLLIVIFEPYIDTFIENGRYHVVLWYTNSDSERVYLNIIGGQS